MDKDDFTQKIEQCNRAIERLRGKREAIIEIAYEEGIIDEKGQFLPEEKEGK